MHPCLQHFLVSLFNSQQCYGFSIHSFNIVKHSISKAATQQHSQPQHSCKEQFLDEHKRVRVESRQNIRSSFQSEGPTTEKARYCLVAVRAKGTMCTSCFVEWRYSNDQWSGTTSAIGWGASGAHPAYSRRYDQFGSALDQPRHTNCQLGGQHKVNSGNLVWRR